MLIKLIDPIGYGECFGSNQGKYWTWWMLIEAGRVYASNQKKAKLEFLGRVT